MAEYMAWRIIEGAYTYDYVIERVPVLKEGIDASLIAAGYGHLITTK